jgi:hypothetical protein
MEIGDFATFLGLLFTAFGLFRIEAAQKVENRLAVTREHREIWSAIYDRPDLARILESDLDLDEVPMTDGEALFVTFLLNHLSASIYASENGMYVPVGAMRTDIRWFFSLPIPKATWEKSKKFQDEKFLRWMEDALRG